MQLDFKEIIQNLKVIEKRFNKSDDPTERYALIGALNEIAEKELPIHGYWEDNHREMMLYAIKKEMGITK